MTLKIAYIFTTFPKNSETFFQREMTFLNKHLTIDIFSLWGGGGYLEKTKIYIFPKWKLLYLLFYCTKHFRALKKLLAKLSKRPHSLSNLFENLLGLAFGLMYAEDFKAKGYHRVHAAWGTAPAMAGWIITRITGIKFSMEAHAYDIYENGGDTFLKEKMADAQFVRTSTKTACKDLHHLCKENKVYLTRRGLSELTSIKPMRVSRNPLRILSIGRLIEKKGFLKQIELLAALKQKGFIFEAKIVGKGPLNKSLKKKIQALGLGESIELAGWLNSTEIKALYQWADVMIFTGKVAKNGDRDGLPNVIAEAMAEGLPVISSNVGGSSEAIIHEKTGLLINSYEMDDEWLEAIKQLANDDNLYRNIQHNARKWIEDNFDLEKNMQVMCGLLVS